MLFSALFTIFAKIINRYLALDAEQAQRLIAYHDKVLEINLLPLNFNFFIRIDQTQIKLTKHSEELISATFSATPLDALALLLSSSSAIPKEVIVTGDLHFVQTLKSVLANIHIDWEELFARYFGDTAAYHIGKQIRRAKNYQQTVKESFIRNSTEYLQEELRYFPTRLEIEDFYQSVDTLRNDVERLAIKIAYLQQSE